MKRTLVLLLSILLVTLLVSCGEKKVEAPKEETKDAVVEETKDMPPKQETKESGGKDPVFEEKDGKMVALDTQSGLFDAPALLVEVDPKVHTFKFSPANEKGETGQDYYLFDTDKKVFEKYYFVSAMGTGHFYTYDLEKEVLVKVEDKDRNDSSEKTKSSGRWEGAEEKIKEEIASLREAFKKLTGKTMEEFFQ